jgi:hypothetical protein
VDLIAIVVGLLAIAAAAVVLFRMMPRQGTKQVRRPPQAKPEPESLMADRDDEQQRVEQQSSGAREAESPELAARSRRTGRGTARS